MAVSEDAKQRWREGRIGAVPLASPRGVLAALFLFLSFAAVLATPVIRIAQFVAGDEAATDQEFDRRALVVNLAFNVVVLIGLPLMAVAVSRPGMPGAVVHRLQLEVRRTTAVHAVLGAAVTVAALIGLALILTGLSEAGIYEAEESELVPQIQELLNWPLVISIGVLAAFTEEIFFRGLLQPRIGLFASSAFFGLIHIGYGTALQVVAPFFLGLLFGFLFQITRSLWTAIAAHFTFDFVQLSLLLLQKEGVIPALASRPFS